MANLLTEAAHTIQRQTNQLKAIKASAKAHEHKILEGATAVTAAGLGALVDAKWKADNGGPANVKGIPVNGAFGALLLGASMIPGMPIPGVIGSAGLGLVEVTLYRYITDNVTFAPKT